MGDDMVKVWVCVEEDGSICTATTTSPDKIPKSEGEVLPNYQYEFEMTWEQLDELWKYKVENGELVLK